MALSWAWLKVDRSTSWGRYPPTHGNHDSPAMTPEQMAQRIAAASSAARREDQAALAKTGEDKARVMADLRAIAGSAWTKADCQRRSDTRPAGRRKAGHC